jgi:hypothetical protein
MDSYNSYNLSFLIKIIATLFFFTTFAFVSRRLRPLWTWVGGGQDIYKGVYYALVLTLLNSRKILILSGTKQRECPVGMLYTCLTLPYSHWCINSPMCIVWYCDGHMCTYRRGASALLVSTGKAMREA